MRLRSRKALLTLVGAVFLVITGAVSSLAGWGSVVDAAMLLLLGAVTVLLLDTRQKLGALQQDSWQIRQSVSRSARLARASAKDSRVARVTMRRLKRRSLSLERSIRASDRVIAEREKGMFEASSRILAMIDKERESASQRHREILTRVRSVTADSQSELSEFAALLQYQDRIPARALLPRIDGSTMNARSLAHLTDLVEEYRPRTVLELGSGTSTVWLGYLLEGDPRSTLVSVDHLREYAEQTREALERHGLSTKVDVRHAPLVSYPVEVSETPWYDEEAFEGVQDVDLLVVDGPPSAVGPLSRLPAMRVLADRLADGALVVLDDSTRPDERETVALWASQFGLEQLDVGVSRLAVLRKSRAAQP